MILSCKRPLTLRFRPKLHALAHPTDIDWTYISKRGKAKWGLRLFLILILILVLLFFTTPASLLNITSFSPSLRDSFSFDWVDESSAFVKFFFRSLMPSILIALINELISYIINATVDLERYYRFSKHQRAQMRKLFIYLFFNMVVVPGFAAVAITNLYEIFKSGVDNFLEFLKQLFVLKSGTLLLIFVINNAGGTFWTSINCSVLLFKNYFVPTITMETTIFYKENESWRKNNGMIFGWGPNYAMNLVITGIGIIFQ